MTLLIKGNAATIKVVGQHVRGMATEKQILMRINSTRNIAKITKSMKMVSAAKMRGAQNRLNTGRPFSFWMDNLFSKPKDVETEGLVSEEATGSKNLIIPISSDRGLCGGVNSFVCKVTKRQLADFEAKNAETSIFVVGEKGRAQIGRVHGSKIIGNVAECWQTVPSFAMASSIAQCALSSGEFDKAHIVYNKFISAIAYATSIRTIDTGALTGSENKNQKLLSYEFEPDNREEVMQDLCEFQLASGIFHGMIEAATSEESSRMSAMENATGNAQDLIGSLTLVYNKARQSRITTELIEIISGATSLQG